MGDELIVTIDAGVPRRPKGPATSARRAPPQKRDAGEGSQRGRSDGSSP